MFPSIVGTQRYGIVTEKRRITRPTVPTPAASGMIGQTAGCGPESASGLPAVRTALSAPTRWADAILSHSEAIGNLGD